MRFIFTYLFGCFLSSACFQPITIYFQAPLMALIIRGVYFGKFTFDKFEAFPTCLPMADLLGNNWVSIHYVLDFTLGVCY